MTTIKFPAKKLNVETTKSIEALKADGFAVESYTLKPIHEGLTAYGARHDVLNLPGTPIITNLTSQLLRGFQIGVHFGKQIKS